MIVVVADDFSGAAELAGVAVSLGYSAEVQTEFAQSEADVVAVDTDTRSLPGGEAAVRLATLLPEITAAGPLLIYKKVDSVLRGNILAELDAIRGVTGQPRAVLAPANPSRGRLIVDGRYLVGGEPIDRTYFADDAEFPARAADVRELLRAGSRRDVVSASPRDALIETGTIVGNVGHADDLAAWASRIGPNTLPAGGAEFFGALLQPRRRATGSADALPMRPPRAALFVCGSAAAWGAGRATDAEQAGIPVIAMPPALFSGDAAEGAHAEWVARSVAALEETGVAMMAIGSGVEAGGADPHLLAKRLTAAVADVLGRVHFELLIVEGGGTASSIARRMGWCRFSVDRVPVPGVVAMSADRGAGMRLITKPGSYPWAPEIWSDLRRIRAAHAPARRTI